MQINFGYAVGYRNDFDIGIHDFSAIMVYINGEILKSFNLSDDGTITINSSDLPVSAEVRVAIAL